MIAVLELLMFLIPWLVYSGVQLQRLPSTGLCDYPAQFSRICVWLDCWLVVRTGRGQA